MCQQGWIVEWDSANVEVVTRQTQGHVLQHPRFPLRIVLDRIHGEASFVERFRAERDDGAIALPDGRVDCVQWDARGRLVVLVDGRIDVATIHKGTVATFTTLVDFCDDAPIYEPTSRWATTWKGL